EFAEALFVLLVADQRALVLLFAADLVLAGDVFGRLDHRVLGVWVFVEVVHHPVFAVGGAAGGIGCGVHNVWAVAATVEGQAQDTVGQAGLNFMGAAGDHAGAGGAGLRVHGAG